VTAESLGLATSPPYLALSSSGSANYVNGVNFASGGAGVSKATNKDQRLSFDKQIDYFASVYASLVQSLGQQQAAAHLAKSLFAITIGSNDIIHYAKSSSATTAQQLVDALIQSLTGQLRRLYNLGARRLLFLGTDPVGCCPSLRELSPGMSAAPWPTTPPRATTPPPPRSSPAWRRAAQTCAARSSTRPPRCSATSTTPRRTASPRPGPRAAAAST
jgi:hypothetical protein